MKIRNFLKIPISVCKVKEGKETVICIIPSKEDYYADEDDEDPVETKLIGKPKKLKKGEWNTMEVEI